jgi:sulfur carrier protein
VELTVNGAAQTVTDGTTLAELITLIHGDGRGIAVAVDGDVVPRPEWPRHELTGGQEIELVTAMQGG